jgi:hypothetical protein
MPRYRTYQGAKDRFDEYIHEIKNRSLNGLRQAQKLIHDDMDTTSPLIPVDTGNMRRSYYAVNSNGTIVAGGAAYFIARKDRKNDDLHVRMMEDHVAKLEFAGALAKIDGRLRGPTIVLGLSAYYAPIVHEMYGNNFKREGAGAGFFAASVKRNEAAIKSILRATMRKSK